MSDRKRSLLAVGCGCCAGVLAVCALFVVALVVGVKSLVSYSIASELTDYMRLVERADIDAETRQQLLEQLEHIRGHARRGDVGFFSWLTFEESLGDLDENGTLTESDVAAFQRELDRLEDEIEPAPSEPPPEPEPAAPDPPLVRAYLRQYSLGSLAWRTSWSVNVVAARQCPAARFARVMISGFEQSSSAA